MIPAFPQSPPMFSSDLAGYVKLAITVIVTGSAAVGFVAWWVRRGPDAAIKELRRDMDGVGGKVNTVETNVELLGAALTENARKETKLDGERDHFRERIAKTEKAVETIMSDIHVHHAEQRDLIEETGRRQTEALHKLELQVARLNERGDLGECFERLGSAIERAMKPTRQGDR